VRSVTSSDFLHYEADDVSWSSSEDVTDRTEEGRRHALPVRVVFFPVIPSIATDLGVTVELINISVLAYMIAQVGAIRKDLVSFF
jgi:hypothetical protein